MWPERTRWNFKMGRDEKTFLMLILTFHVSNFNLFIFHHAYLYFHNFAVTFRSEVVDIDGALTVRNRLILSGAQKKIKYAKALTR